MLQKASNNVNNLNEYDNDTNINQIVVIFTETITSSYEPKLLILELQIGKKPFTFECDTGSPITLISEKDFNTLKFKFTFTKYKY